MHFWRISLDLRMAMGLTIDLMSISSPLHLSESIPKSSETRPNFDPIVKLRASRPSILRVDWNCGTCVKNDNVDMQKRSLHHELIQMVGTWKPWMRQEIKRGEYWKLKDTQIMFWTKFWEQWVRSRVWEWLPANYLCVRTSIFWIACESVVTNLSSVSSVIGMFLISNISSLLIPESD